jgi:hypothetical protein
VCFSVWPWPRIRSRVRSSIAAKRVYLDAAAVAQRRGYADRRAFMAARVIVSPALGGTWPGAPAATTGFLERMLVDRVPVHAR